MKLLRGFAGHEVISRTLVVALASVIVILMQGTAVFAAGDADDPPIYNPASQSYFQLVTLLPPGQPNSRWIQAYNLVQKLSFKGVRGRLAVVDSAETHKFIRQNFNIVGPTWIGLRYWCHYRKLMWNTSRPFAPRQPENFSAWHTQWQRSENVPCDGAAARHHALGVYYSLHGGEDFRWQAVGPQKGFPWSLVEYPTGSE